MPVSDADFKQLRNRFDEQLRRRESQISNQVQSINRLLVGGSYSNEMKALHERLAEATRKLEEIAAAQEEFFQANNADGSEFAASAADGLKLARLVKKSLDSSTLEG